MYADADANANADVNAEGSTKALRERCSGELIKLVCSFPSSVYVITSANLAPGIIRGTLTQ